nr:hypothetical protein [Baekduia soli]
MVVVVGDVEARGGRVQRDALRSGQVHVGAAELRRARRRQRRGVEHEALDAVVALVGDVDDRRGPRRGLGDGEAARADPRAGRRIAADQVEDRAVAEARQVAAVVGGEDLDAFVLGVEHVEVARAVDGQAADHPQPAVLAARRAAAEAQAREPVGREGLHDARVLVGDEDGAPARADGDGLREAEHPVAVGRLAHDRWGQRGRGRDRRDRDERRQHGDAREQRGEGAAVGGDDDDGSQHAGPAACAGPGR